MTNRTELTAERIERSINYMAEMRRLCCAAIEKCFMAA